MAEEAVWVSPRPGPRAGSRALYREGRGRTLCQWPWGGSRGAGLPDLPAALRANWEEVT